MQRGKNHMKHNKKFRYREDHRASVLLVGVLYDISRRKFVDG